MTKKDRYKNLIDYFTVNLPEPETELNYNNPFELLVAVILSAQCTDKRVNMVVPALFDMFPTAEHLSHAHFDEAMKNCPSRNQEKCITEAYENLVWDHYKAKYYFKENFSL